MEERIQNGEGEQLDFKLKIDNQLKIAKTLAAFANTKGGDILIGVKESGKVVGCDPSEEFHMISAAADLYTEPIVEFTTKIHQVKHKLVLEVSVPKSNELHLCLDENQEWLTYIRIQELTLEANPVLKRVLEFRLNGQARPSKIEPDFLEVLQLMKQDEFYTFSKLDKIVNVKINRLEEILALLIFWKVLVYKMSDSGLVYGLKK